MRVRGEDDELVLVARANYLCSFEVLGAVVTARNAALVQALRPQIDGEQVRRRARPRMRRDGGDTSDRHGESLELVRERHLRLRGPGGSRDQNRPGASP